MRQVITKDFNPRRYSFEEWFKDVLGVADLERLHETCAADASNYYRWVKLFCSMLEDRFGEIDNQISLFFKEVVEPTFGPIVSRQVLPTPRTHLAVKDDSLCAEECVLHAQGPREFLRQFYFDRPRPAMFHRDRDYGLTSGTVNLWIPLTRVFGTNSLWIGGPDRRGRDAVPAELSPGECLFFDGANRWHGVVWNTSGITRAGFDIRFFPEDGYIFRTRLNW